MLAMVLLMVAAFASGVLNAVAGGGAFITFPALLFAGVPPVSANVSSTVALFPGQMASAWAYRKEIRGVTEVSVTAFSVVSLIGGVVGAILLLTTPDRAFAGLVPWLLLFATAVFAVGSFMPALAARLRLSGRSVLVVQFVIAIYGGYFGGGIGFLMLAALTLFGLRDIHAMNGLRILLAALMNGAAVAAFCLSDAVSWPETAVMAVSAIAGGYAGAHAAKRVSRDVMKWVVVSIGVGLTLYFFIRGAGA
ncbi:TSUP family transporter [Azospirillum formosense]|uniref:Probable membrane transporter protein n=1 Tax=Azospirillum formosense TaxID=861533 RepID=A0ABX2L023_9PROT|nr:sulfite exporter TauE/SafE family protein [Azospirillum formosense]MBY3752927.1 sulfite exporter TauE/SafE family protein [Azospirillum formosense]NUB20177.1 TSUP family transporter [Azospirillum formosense]